MKQESTSHTVKQELSGHAISMIVPADEKCDLYDAQNGHAVSSV